MTNKANLEERIAQWAGPGRFDVLQLLLVASALIVDALALLRDLTNDATRRYTGGDCPKLPPGGLGRDSWEHMPDGDTGTKIWKPAPS